MSLQYMLENAEKIIGKLQEESIQMKGSRERNCSERMFNLLIRWRAYKRKVIRTLIN